MTTALDVATLVAALVAAAGAIVAARLAAVAAAKTTRLTAQLAEAGGLQNWRRQEFLTLVSEFLAAGHKHRLSVDALLRPTATYSRPRNAAAGQELREFELMAWKLSLVASESVQAAGNALYLRHLAAAAEYTTNGPRDANRWPCSSMTSSWPRTNSWPRRGCSWVPTQMPTPTLGLPPPIRHEKAARRPVEYPNRLVAGHVPGRPCGPSRGPTKVLSTVIGPIANDLRWPRGGCLPKT